MKKVEEEETNVLGVKEEMLTPKAGVEEVSEKEEISIVEEKDEASKVEDKF